MRAKFIFLSMFFALGIVVSVVNFLFASSLASTISRAAICAVNDSTQYEIFNPLTNTNGTAVHAFYDEDYLVQYTLVTLTPPEDNTLISVGNVPVGYTGNAFITADFPFTVSVISGIGVVLMPSFDVMTQTGLIVSFDNTSHGYDSVLWDFGDGITSTVESPIHQFPTSGVYTTTLTVNRIGCFDSFPFTGLASKVVIDVKQERIFLPVIVNP